MKKLISTAFYVLMAFVFPGVARAQEIPTSVVTTSDTFGGFTNLQTIFAWIFNIFIYLGWAGVFIGLGFILFSLIYKLMNSDNEEAMKTVQGYITKAILIVIAGLLLISISFIINFVATFLGYGDTANFWFGGNPTDTE